MKNKETEMNTVALVGFTVFAGIVNYAVIYSNVKNISDISKLAIKGIKTFKTKIKDSKK